MEYEGFGIRCIGQSHLENNTVCQDNVQYIQSLKYTVAAVSDGHGGQKYFRSDIGSEYAALIGCEKLSEFLLKSNYLFLDEKSKKNAIDQLIDSIVTEWNISVREHIAHFPFKESELSLVDAKNIEEYKNLAATEQDNTKNKEHYSSVFKAYGATLICIGMCDEFGIGLHIGDGKCVAMYEDGSMDEPIPWDEKCHLNKCTSICDKNAVSEFRVYVWENKLPMCVYIASDGIDDTFSDRLHSFYRSVTLDLIESEFRDKVDSLEEKLPNISKNGSQDDVSVAGIINIKQARDHKDDMIAILNREQLEYQLNAVEKELEKLSFKKDNIEKLISYEATDERLLKREEINKLIEESEGKVLDIKKELGIIPDDPPEKETLSDNNEQLSDDKNTSDGSGVLKDTEPDTDVIPLPDEECDSAWDE